MSNTTATQSFFRIGTTADIIEGLRFAHDHGIEMPDRAWGLKLIGYAMCAQQLHDEKFGVVLEAGAGFGDEMHRAFGGTSESPANREMWTIDNTEFYDEAKVAAGRAKRVGCRDVNGLLGDFLPELPAEHFDAVFSVSALEHAPMDTVRAVCEDMFRVTKPGGLSMHTLDFPFDKIDELMVPWLDELRRAGFTIDDHAVDLTVGLTNAAGDAYLFEPIENVFRRWSKRRIDDGRPLLKYKTRHGAVVLVAHKPG